MTWEEVEQHARVAERMPLPEAIAYLSLVFDLEYEGPVDHFPYTRRLEFVLGNCLVRVWVLNNGAIEARVFKGVL
jgi:hypothetical protein